MPTSVTVANLLTRWLPRTLLALAMILSVCLVEAEAQSKKKRHRTSKPAAAKPVITNPTIAPPNTGQNSDVKVISTADQDQADPDKTTDPQSKKSKTATRGSSDEEDDLKQTIKTLSNRVDRLTDKLSQQDDDREMKDMERLTRAEQRSEQLRSNLVDVQTRLSDLQSRLEQVEYSLKPENIDRATMTYGTVHPEEARDSRRRQLESEKKRLQDQIGILETSRTRLEQSIATADNEVDLLRARLNQQRDQEILNPKTESRPSNPRKPDQ